MRNPFLLPAMLCFVIFATAVTYTDAGSSRASVQQSGKADKPAPAGKPVDQQGQSKVQGCLSVANGNFNLTDGSGTIYRMTGDTSKLAEYNGHQIEATGAVTPPTSGQPDSQPTLTIASVQDVASTCSPK
jgi:hypothetical protein